MNTHRNGTPHRLAKPVTRRRWLVLSGGLLSLSATLAQPQTPLSAWPTKAVKLVVTYPPGGVSDGVARALAEQLALRLGVPVLVDNKAGASGTLGVNAVAKSAPDGYTLAFAALSPLTLNPHLGKSPFDPAKDITPVASVMYSPVLILATPAAQDTDFKALLATARARPGAVRWATSGPASLGHVMLEQIRASTQLNITHVPYKGGGQQITDALSGQFEVLSVNASSSVLQYIKTGKLRALAVGAPARLDSLPGVPTLAELGYPAANLSSLFGVLAPAGTPAPVIDRLNLELNAVLALPAIRERLLAAECVPMRSSTAEFARLIAIESGNMRRIIRDAQIREE
jgi:tripartite-type tricarboxylate transporter receptor subunit TctC